MADWMAIYLPILLSAGIGGVATLLYALSVFAPWLQLLYQLMRLVYDVPGDTAECGVYNGAGSYLICRVNQSNPSQPRRHFMFDAFSGLPEPSRLDGSHWSAGDMCCDMEMVKKNMADIDNYTIYQGWIPNRFAEVNGRRFALVHIDVDLYHPTRQH